MSAPRADPACILTRAPTPPRVPRRPAPRPARGKVVGRRAPSLVADERLGDRHVARVDRGDRARRARADVELRLSFVSTAWRTSRPLSPGASVKRFEEVALADEGLALLHHHRLLLRLAHHAAVRVRDGGLARGLRARAARARRGRGGLGDNRSRDTTCLSVPAPAAPSPRAPVPRPPPPHDCAAVNLEP